MGEARQGSSPGRVVALRPDGGCYAIIDSADRASIWDFETHEMLEAIDSSEPVAHLAWLSNGELLLRQSSGMNELRAGGEAHRFQPQHDFVLARKSPVDDRYLLVGRLTLTVARVGTPNVWRTRTLGQGRGNAT